MNWTTITLFLLSPLLKWLTATTLVGIGGLFLFFAWPAWLPGRRFANVAGVVGVAALTGGAFYWYAFHAGERHMAQRIAAKDRAAVQRIDAGTKEVLACNDGVDWDVSVGACRPGSFAGSEK